MSLRVFLRKIQINGAILNNCFARAANGKTKMSLIYDGLPLNGYHFARNCVTTQCEGEDQKTTASGEAKVTLAELKQALARDMGVDHPYKRTLDARQSLTKYLPKSQDEMVKRSMQDSYIAAVIPLSDNVALQEKYTTFLGSVRLGRLLEDMDIFAVIVCRKHILNPGMPAEGANFPQTLVTVLVDRIEFTDYLTKANKDIKISGHVSWVSKSTMEVVVWLEQFDEGRWNRITRALFLLAARNSTNTGASVVNAIAPANAREKEILSGGDHRKAKRLEYTSIHVSKKVPNSEEQKLLHDIYVKTTDPADISMSKRVLPPNCIWMSSTKVSNAILAHPEDRNLHNSVFGGFIMRQATELSWIASCMFCKFKPKTKCLNDVTFKSPIAVNSLIQMHATVVYAQDRFIQTSVFAQVYEPHSGETATTNSFHFTLEAPEVVPEVIPQTYYEAMLYITGLRYFEKWKVDATKSALKSKM